MNLAGLPTHLVRQVSGTMKILLRVKKIYNLRFVKVSVDQIVSISFDI